MTGRRLQASAALLALVCLACLSLPACQGTGAMSTQPGTAGRRSGMTLSDAYLDLQDRLDTLHVSGVVKTSQGLLLPETIIVQIRSEICVESRRPGQRFWSLDYDTCFVYVSSDTVDGKGEYAVGAPCIDPDRTYESEHSFAELRLVPKGPVSFRVDSDAGWRHQETFTSSRSHARDLNLELETEVFWVVHEPARLQERPLADSPVIAEFGFGTGMDVIRFHQGWAQCLVGERIGWMEMRVLGTEQEMDELAPLRAKPEAKTTP